VAATNQSKPRYCANLRVVEKDQLPNARNYYHYWNESDENYVDLELDYRHANLLRNQIKYH
jgi:hypothetical protein